MSPHVTIEIAELQNKTVNQLVQRYEQVFNEECRSRNKQYLIRRIAWRLQANEEGGLSRAALKKAAELAEDAETRVASEWTLWQSLRIDSEKLFGRVFPAKNALFQNCASGCDQTCHGGVIQYSHYINQS